MNQPVILLGSGGHAAVLLDSLHCRNIDVLGYVDCAESSRFMDVKYLGNDDCFLAQPIKEIMLVNGVGNIERRQQLFDAYKKHGFSFSHVIHPSAIISNTAELAEGVQVMAGAVIQTGVRIDENVIINTHVSIDHDCCIGKHSHIAVGAVLAGNVSVSKKVFIGAGSTVIQGLDIASNSIVGAGAVVIRNVMQGQTVVGVPAN